ncbi:MAG TPA: DUF5818 domain-containing protein [Terriglobales bacterium]|nr:DUF5818 domain-containing protein [Terriglobales bacterium]
MNKTFSLLATIALAAVLLPIAFAQQGQTAQPSTDQTAQPSSTQPSTDQSTPSTDQVQPATQAPSQAPATTAAPAATQSTFTGTVVKAGGKYVLKNDTMTYQLDDQVKAGQFEGKTVTVSGDLDKSTSIIHVSDIMSPDQK